MNVYQAALDPSGCLKLGSQRLPLGPLYASPLAPGLAAYSGRQVIVGVRPEDLALGSELRAIFSIDAPAAGALELAAAAGETESAPFGLAYNGVARLGPRAAVRPGDRVAFHVDTSRLHFFDPDTGAALARDLVSPSALR